MVDLSVVVLTKNEEKNILDCLECLKSIKDIIVIDDNSSDRTEEVVRTSGFNNVRFFKHELNGNFAMQRNFGLGKSKKDWIMFVDADERISEKLIEET